MSDWGRKIRFADLGRGPLELDLRPDEGERARIAKQLRLDGLPAFAARVELRPWLDGAELRGRFDATAMQTCGVTLEPLEQALSGAFEIRLLPAGSPNAPEAEDGGEIALDLEAPDPPDVLEGEEIDVAAYAVEQLALEIDPFPRKPGVEFDYVPEPPGDSPFAALGALKRRKP